MAPLARGRRERRERRGLQDRATAVAAGTVAVGLIGLLGVLHAYLTRPFWYDEIWRAHFVSEPMSSFWRELTVANTPSAIGWLGLTRVAGEVLGWHSWSLRLPGYLALPALGAGIVLLTRRFSGLAAAVFAAGWLCLNATFLDLATQLKPYTLEALAAVCVVGLWVTGPAPPDGSGRGDVAGPRLVGPRLVRRRLVRRTAAGLVALTAVPGIFLVVPLALAEIRRGPGRRWRALETLPAVALTLAHTGFFLGHQSSQRQGDYWDRQFLAGRGPVGGLRFIADQIGDLLTGTPPGIDRFDPSLVHAAMPGGRLVSVPSAIAVAIAGLVGIAVLARRSDGRLLLAALGGAQLMMLGASAVRFWPFGPTRTNLFLVPLIILVVVTGAERVIGLLLDAARRQMPRGGPETDADPLWSTGPILPIQIPVIAASRTGRSEMAATLGVGGDTQEHRLPTIGLATFPGPTASTTAPGPSEVSPSIGSPPEAGPPAPTAGGGSRPAATPATSPGVGGPARWLLRRGRSRRSFRWPPRLTGLTGLTGAVLIMMLGGVLLADSVAANDRVWAHRNRLRGLDLMVDATIATRQQARPGDLVVVGGRLARPGWLYAMEASDDPARRPARPPGGGGGPVPPRIPQRDTIFFGAPGTTLAGELAARPVPPTRLLVFVFDIERARLAPDLAALRTAGWCGGASTGFRLTGTLTVYDRCGPAAS